MQAERRVEAEVQRRLEAWAADETAWPAAARDEVCTGGLAKLVRCKVWNRGSWFRVWGCLHCPAMPWMLGPCHPRLGCQRRWEADRDLWEGVRSTHAASARLGSAGEDLLL